MADNMYIAHDIEAVFAAWREAPHARVCAGGTDVLVQIKDMIAPPPLIDISRIATLRNIDATSENIRIGAFVTYTQLCETALLPPSAAALREAAWLVGSPQIRHRGTVGGNIMNASPAGDLLPPLIALNATATCVSEDVKENAASHPTEKIYPLDKFFLAPRKLCVGEHALLTHVCVPRNEGWFSSFMRVGQRRALAISKASVACALRVENDRVAEIRIALGSVAPRVVRAHTAEAELVGTPWDTPLPQAAYDAVHADATPITDIRSTDAYRRAMCGVLLARAWERVRAAHRAHIQKESPDVA